jgi:hypothetical protein
MDTELQTIEALHSSTLEIFLISIEKQMDIEAREHDEQDNWSGGMAAAGALSALYNNVRCAQVNAIERETGA